MVADWRRMPLKDSVQPFFAMAISDLYCRFQLSNRGIGEFNGTRERGGWSGAGFYGINLTVFFRRDKHRFCCGSTAMVHVGEEVGFVPLSFVRMAEK
jgi:hypothetical protein